MNRPSIPAVTFTILGLAAMARAQEVPWREQLQRAKLSIGEAIEKAQVETGHAVAFEAELEVEEGALVWSIDLAKGGSTLNVVLDATSGKVVAKKTEDGDRQRLVGAARLTLLAAVETATKASGGQAIEATLRFDADKPVADVRVLEPRATVPNRIRIDAATGELVPGARAVAERPALGEGAAGAAPQERAWTGTFHVRREDLKPTGRNPFFVLEPGYRLTLRGEDEGKTVELVVSVLNETRVVDGVETRVVEERESENGALKEVSRNFYAICSRTNGVFYFGEEVDVYENGRITSHEGAWLAGENGARFGLMMPGMPLLGARYFQEIAPQVAMDRAEIVGLDETLETPAGTFERVLKCEETTPLENATEHKWYAPGVGLVRDAALVLVEIEK